MGPDLWHTDTTAEQKRTSMQKEQGVGIKKATLRPLSILATCKATWFSSVEDAGKGTPWFGKDIKIHDAHNASNLHQGVTEPAAVEAQGKRQSTPNQLTGFKVYLKILWRDEHLFFFLCRVGMDFPYRDLATSLLQEERGHTSPLGPGGKRLLDLTIILWSVSAIQDKTMPERPEAISQGIVKAG